MCELEVVSNPPKCSKVLSTLWTPLKNEGKDYNGGNSRQEEFLNEFYPGMRHLGKDKINQTDEEKSEKDKKGNFTGGAAGVSNNKDKKEYKISVGDGDDKIEISKNINKNFEKEKVNQYSNKNEDMIKKGDTKIMDKNKSSDEKIDNTVFSDNAWRKTRSLIQGTEKFEAKAYKPTKNDVWTIGYGHTKGVKEGDTITKEQAEELYKKDFEEYSKILKKVKVSLNDNEKAALTSFAYNVGTGAFANSTLLKKLNNGDKKGAANEFDKWIYQNGQKLDGLVDRRKKEKKLFLTPDE